MIKKLRDPDTIDKDFNFPPKIFDLISLILKKGYSLTLVGGCVRDWLLNRPMGMDFDFELGHNKHIPSWEAYMDDLIHDLETRTSFKVSKLPFSIIKLESNGFCVELASIRTETYKEQSVYGHCDFDCKISPLLNFKDAALRRDLTINALGVGLTMEGKALTFHDPFNGLHHLRKGIIKNIDGNFFKDPVRFLRAVRFSLQLHMKFDPELTKQFHRFNLMSLSNHYFFSEAFKGDFFPFARIFFSLVKAHNIPIPDSLGKLVFFKDLVFTSSPPRHPQEVLLALIFSKKSIDKENLMNFIKYAGINKTLPERFQSYKKNLNDLSSISPISLMKKVKNQTPQQIMENKELKICSKFFSLFKNDHEILERILPSSEFKIYKRWRIHIPKKLEGKKLFLKLKKTMNPQKKQMAVLRIYAHFIDRKPNSFIQE